MVRSSAIAVCGALLAFAPRAGAQELTGRVRVMGGYVTEAYPTPAPRLSGVVALLTPEVSLFWGREDSRRNLTYSLTGALQTQTDATELAHRLTLATSTRLDRRTVLNLSIGGIQSTLSNLLITSRTSGVGAPTTGTLLPNTDYKLLGGSASQSLQHELSPVWTVTQTADVDTFTTLPPTPSLTTLMGGVGGAIERAFATDAIGVAANVGYVHTRSTPPDPDLDFAYVDAGPRWRSDWSRTLSSLVSGGVAVLFDPVVTYPSASASLLYTPGGATASGEGGRQRRAVGLSQGSAELSASTGIVPSPLTGQIARSHQVTLRGDAPILLPARVVAGAMVGVAHSELINPTSGATDLSFNALITNVNLAWQVTDAFQIFGQYQFIGQVGDTTATGVSPSFLRDMFMIGLELSSRPPGTDSVSTRLPQRVDQSDGPPPTNTGDREPDPEPTYRRRPSDVVDDGAGTRALPERLDTPGLSPRDPSEPREPREPREAP